MNRSVLWIGAFALAGCAGAAGPQPSPVIYQTEVVHSLPAGGSSVASIKTLTNATCQLHQLGETDASKTLRVYADDDGIARVHLQSLDATATGGKLILECADDAGNTEAHTINVQVSAGAKPTPAAPYIIAGKPTLAVLDMAPEQMTAADLLARNYPPRPDAANADQYSAWLNLVTSAPTVINPHLVTDASRVHGPAKSNGNGTSGNWSGYVIATPSTASEYAWIYGEWNVPRAYAESGFYSSDHSSEWVGIDGWGSPDVVQDGTDADTLTVFWVQTSSYDAWTEWFPLSSQSVSNFPVNPGDDVHAWTWVTDANGNYTSKPTVGRFYLWNSTQNVYAYVTTNVPSGTTFNGHCAEWVMERPTVNGSLSTLSQYASPAQIFNASAYDLNGAQHFYPGDASDESYNLTMVNGSTQLSTVAPVNQTTMAFTWHNHS